MAAGEKQRRETTGFSEYGNVRFRYTPLPDGRLDISIAIYSYIHMHRTTILLPDGLHRAATREAHSLGLSLGELIRRRLTPAAEASTPAFFSREPWGGDGPTDLATDHDRHLYGP